MTLAQTSVLSPDSIGKDVRQAPYARSYDMEAEKDSRTGATFLSKSFSYLCTQVAPSDGCPGSGHVLVQQFRDAVNLKAAERWHRLKDHQAAVRITCQMAELHVTFGDDDFEHTTEPTEPDR